MVIRKAVEQDRKEIAYVFADSFSHDWKALSDDTNKVAGALESGCILKDYVVAIEDGKAVGFLALVSGKTRAFQVPIKVFQKEFGFFKGYMIGMALKSDMEREIVLEEEEAYIDIIGVRKSYQHRGIASKLLDYIIKNCDYNSYLLSVTDINTNAIACYKKKGFKEIRREKVKFAKQKGFSEYLYLKYIK